MASLVLSGDTSGSITVSAPAVAGSTTQTLVNVTGTLAPIVSGTAVTASSTSVDFTGIPSWVKRITVMFSGVSTNGTSLKLIQIGDSGGIENTAYFSGSSFTTTGGSTGGATATTGFNIYSNTAPDLMSGAIVLTLISGTTWVAQGALVADAGTDYVIVSAGTKTLSDTLTQVRITTVNGTDTFDAGTINILYE